MSPKVWITAYDKFSAILAEESSVDVILIGDSLSMTVYGTDSTQDLPVEILLFHAESVKRYAPNIEIVLDIPYKIAALAKDMEKNSGIFRFCKKNGDK